MYDGEEWTPVCPVNMSSLFSGKDREHCLTHVIFSTPSLRSYPLAEYIEYPNVNWTVKKDSFVPTSIKTILNNVALGCRGWAKASRCSYYWLCDICMWNMCNFWLWCCYSMCCLYVFIFILLLWGQLYDCNIWVQDKFPYGTITCSLLYRKVSYSTGLKSVLIIKLVYGVHSTAKWMFLTFIFTL